MHLTVLGILFAYFVLLFLVGQVLKDNSIVDIGWGFSFFVAALISFFLGQTFMPRATLITALVALWGLRLSIHLAIRNIGKGEDYRYVEFRKRWGDRFVRLKAFLHVYFLQFTVMAVVSMPLIQGNLNPNQTLGPLAYFGMAVWVIGFLFEAVGDLQLKRFKADPANKGKLLDKGLWALTRHPNYFGDAVMWFGIFFISITEITTLWTLIGPIIMAFFLRNISGAKMLERKYEGRADYDAYKERTNMFVPGPPRKI